MGGLMDIVAFLNFNAMKKYLKMGENMRHGWVFAHYPIPQPSYYVLIMYRLITIRLRRNRKFFFKQF